LVVNGRQAAQHPMSSFSVDDDKGLLILVVLFGGDDATIAWDHVHRHISPTSKTIPELQQRLEYLKCTETRCSMGSRPTSSQDQVSKGFNTTEHSKEFTPLSMTSSNNLAKPMYVNQVVNSI